MFCLMWIIVLKHQKYWLLEVLSTVIMTNQTNAISGIITQFLLYLMPGKGVSGYGD